MKTKTELKAEKSFNYACNQAIKCRHNLYMVSCFSCPHFVKCDTQNRIEKARKKM